MKKAALGFFLFFFSLSLQGAVYTPAANWKEFIARITAGDKEQLIKLPETLSQIGDSLEAEQTFELADALSFALIANSLVTLAATDKTDKSENYAVQRFGTQAICALIISYSWSKASTLKYYALASAALKKAGKPAEECLSIMQMAMAEIEQEEQRGEMVWGNKTFNPQTP